MRGISLKDVFLMAVVFNIVDSNQGSGYRVKSKNAFFKKAY